VNLVVAAPAIGEPAAGRVGVVRALALRMVLPRRLRLVLRAELSGPALLERLSRRALILRRRLTLRLRPGLGLALGLRLALRLRQGLALLLRPGVALRLRLGRPLRLRLGLALLLRLSTGRLLLIVLLSWRTAVAAAMVGLGEGEAARDRRGRQDGGEEGPVHGRRTFAQAR
jgi:hypothetical protein